MQMKLFVHSNPKEIEDNVNNWLGDRRIVVEKSEMTSNIQYFLPGTGARTEREVTYSLVVWFSLKEAS